MMKDRKKMMLGMALGALLIGGGLFGYVHAQSRPAVLQNRLICAQARPGMPMREVEPAEAAARIAEAFGVDKTQVQNAIEAGRDYRDIGRAAMLAQICGKSFDDVITRKTDDNTWHAVEKELGVTREQLREGFCAIEARHLAEQDVVDQETALKLVKDGYEIRDIRAASVIAKAAGKDIQTVLDRKRINNRWHDVARELGVEDAVGDWQLDGRGYGPGPRCDFDDDGLPDSMPARGSRVAAAAT